MKIGTRVRLTKAVPLLGPTYAAGTEFEVVGPGGPGRVNLGTSAGRLMICGCPIDRIEALPADPQPSQPSKPRTKARQPAAALFS